MERQRLFDYWAELVQNRKETEKEYGISMYATEQLARECLRYIRRTRIRQYTLFTQRRGEEFEQLLRYLQQEEFNEEAIQRMVMEDDFWKATLEMAEL